MLQMLNRLMMVTDLPNRHSIEITTTVERGAHKLRMSVKNLLLATCFSTNYQSI